MRLLCSLIFSFLFSVANAQTPRLTRAQLHDKVLGMLVGSAIGDAMSAPTEMWSREMISTMYGAVNRLDSMVREPSVEGTCVHD